MSLVFSAPHDDRSSSGVAATIARMSVVIAASAGIGYYMGRKGSWAYHFPNHVERSIDKNKCCTLRQNVAKLSVNTSVVICEAEAKLQRKDSGLQQTPLPKLQRPPEVEELSDLSTPNRKLGRRSEDLSSNRADSFHTVQQWLHGSGAERQLADCTQSPQTPAPVAPIMPRPRVPARPAAAAEEAEAGEESAGEATSETASWAVALTDATSETAISHVGSRSLLDGAFVKGSATNLHAHSSSSSLPPASGLLHPGAQRCGDIVAAESLDEQATETIRLATHAAERKVPEGIAPDPALKGWPGVLVLALEQIAYENKMCGGCALESPGMHNLLKALRGSVHLVAPASACTIYLHDEDSPSALWTLDEAGARVPAAEDSVICSALEEVCGSRNPVIFFDKSHTALTMETDARPDAQKKCHICLPFMSCEGFGGMMEIVRTMPEASELDQLEVTLLLLLGHSFERIITEAVTQKAKADVERRYRTLVSMSERALAATTPFSLLEQLNTEVAALVEAEKVTLFLEDISGGVLRTYGAGPGAGVVVPLDGDSICARAMRTGTTLTVSDEKLEGQAEDARLDMYTSNMLAMPIPMNKAQSSQAAGAGKNVGVLQVLNFKAGDMSEQDLIFLRGFAAIVGNLLFTSLQYKRLLTMQSYNSRQLEFFGETTIIPAKSHQRRVSQEFGGAHAALLSANSAYSCMQPVPSPSDVEAERARPREGAGHQPFVAAASEEEERCANEFDDSRRDMLDSSEDPGTQKIAEGVLDGPPAAAAASGTQFRSPSKAAEQAGAGGQMERKHRARSLSSGNDAAMATASTFFASMRRRSTMHANSSSWGMGLVDGDDHSFQFNKAALVGDSAAVLDWYFDVLLYDQEALVQMAVHCFEAFDIPRRFQISPARLFAFVRKVLSMYNDTPFHNAHHAFHVFQNCVMMVWAVPELASSISLLDVFALLVAALCHDVDHVGTNNTYHINSWSKLSLRYNDISVMEQHHCSICFKLLTDPETNIVTNLTYHSRSLLRKLICSAILATDMNNHHKNLELMKAHRGLAFAKDNLSDRMLLVSIILHTADLCNPCLSLAQSKQWEKRISQEFQFQAALEREYGLPVAPFMEKSDQLSRISNQNHFIESFAYPQWQAAVELFPAWTPRLQQLQRNMEYFKKLKRMLAERPQDKVRQTSPLSKQKASSHGLASSSAKRAGAVENQEASLAQANTESTSRPKLISEDAGRLF